MDKPRADLRRVLLRIANRARRDRRRCCLMARFVRQLVGMAAFAGVVAFLFHLP
jgi:hypothetical protein